MSPEQLSATRLYWRTVKMIDRHKNGESKYYITRSLDPQTPIVDPRIKFKKPPTPKEFPTVPFTLQFN